MSKDSDKDFVKAVKRFRQPENLYTEKEIVDRITACSDLKIICADYGHHDYRNELDANEVLVILNEE